MRDTIAALATAPGRAAIAVIRISGPQAGEALDRLAGSRPQPRAAAVRRLRDPEAGEPIDEALALWFPGPGSFTGEDQAELHIHGGPATVDAVLNALFAFGLRPAEPGEFTRRAFANGRLDLSQAEAIADLVDAETQAQRRQALSQLGGALTRRYDSWRETLIEALSLLEAEIDFPDEDLPQRLSERAREPLEELAREIAASLDDHRGEQVREGYRIALVGAPNAGKSSLLNALVGREAAIVTETPGTTRDVIEAPLVLEGYRVVLADMAGVRDTQEFIEAEGVRRARAWGEAADLRLWVVDQSAGEGAWREAAGLTRPGDLLVLNKADLPVGPDADQARGLAEKRKLPVISSRATPDGVQPLLQAMGCRAVEALTGSDFPAATRARHRALLADALEHLRRALSGLSGDAELAAEDVRLASRALERLSGRIDAEAVLDRVFGSFCIGK